MFSSICFVILCARTAVLCSTPAKEALPEQEVLPGWKTILDQYVKEEGVSNDQRDRILRLMSGFNALMNEQVDIESNTEFMRSQAKWKEIIDQYIKEEGLDDEGANRIIKLMTGISNFMDKRVEEELEQQTHLPPPAAQQEQEQHAQPEAQPQPHQAKPAQ